jgi:hypothetical protein
MAGHSFAVGVFPPPPQQQSCQVARGSTKTFQNPMGMGDLIFPRKGGPMSFCTSFFFFLPLSPNFKQLVVDDVASFAPGGSVVAATSIPLVNDPASKTGHMSTGNSFFFFPNQWNLFLPLSQSTNR